MEGLDRIRRDPEFVRLLPYLSAHLRQASERGQVVEVDHENWQRLAEGHAHTSVSRKLGMLLQLFSTRSTSAGKAVILSLDDFVVLDAADVEEMEFLIGTLVEQGAVRRRDSTGLLGHIVTAKGWERLAPTDPGGVPGTCFVAMAFDPSLDDAYEHGIKPAIKAAGLAEIRVDRVHHNGIVTDLIHAEIRRAQVTVADVTLQRQGVYFEAGLAIGLGRTVVFCCREDQIKDVHFDTRQYNHVVWKDAADLRTKLEHRIKGTVAISVNLTLPPQH